jgi:hypothetical protein
MKRAARKVVLKLNHPQVAKVATILAIVKSVYPFAAVSYIKMRGAFCVGMLEKGKKFSAAKYAEMDKKIQAKMNRAGVSRIQSGFLPAGKRVGYVVGIRTRG